MPNAWTKGTLRYEWGLNPSKAFREIPEGSFDDVYLLQFLHTIESYERLEAWLLRSAKILRPGGFLRIVVPFYRSSSYWKNPRACRVLTEESFDPWCRGVALDPQERDEGALRPYVREAYYPDGARLVVELRLVA